jgi:hypothetical protein
MVQDLHKTLPGMRLRTPLLALALLASASFVAPAVAAIVPWTKVPAAQLAPKGYQHQQVLQIHQDFHPNDDYEIALDAWVADQKPNAIAGVRMWWLDTATSNERSPFGKGVRKHIGINYEEQDDGDWQVKITQGRKEYLFEVEMNERGAIQAYADVVSGSDTIEHCRVDDSRLVARKVLGIPAGLKGLDVSCVDGDGKKHKGYVVRRDK